MVAAVIQDQDKYFSTQRGYGEYKGGWEFPGGKVEPGESDEAALIREIREELKIDISIGNNVLIMLARLTYHTQVLYGKVMEQIIQSLIIWFRWLSKGVLNVP